MAASQFTYYSSSDASSPGPLVGNVAGNLLTVLDACLVNGYGSKAAAGWTKPFVNAGNIGCYKQGAGSGFGVVINDNGANVTSTTREAWATGWETIASVGSPVGTGSGQFPLPSQLLTTGHVVISKSTTTDGTQRPWMVFADASTFYLFVFTGAASGLGWVSFRFGDIYSFKGSTDAYRCMIHGQATENGSSSIGRTVDNQDIIAVINSGAANGIGCYIARSFGGGGVSQTGLQCGDMTHSGADGTATLGIVPSPNGPDNSFYISPLQIIEASNNQVRGRFRGLYYLCHAVANFGDGQSISGSGDFAGKTFQNIKVGRNGGMWLVETSATVETN